MFRKFASFALAVYRDAHAHEIAGMAAGLAFFSLFAMPPVLVALLLVGGALVGDEAAHDSLLDALEQGMGQDARAEIEGMLSAAPQLGTGSPLTHGLTVIVFFFAALGGFRHLQTSFDIIWHAPRTGVRYSLIRLARRIASFGVVMLVGVLMLVAISTGLVVTSFPEQIGTRVDVLARPAVVFLLEAGSISFIAFLILVPLYKIVPNTRVPWRSAFAGALFSSLCLSVGRYPVAFYLQHTWRSTAFGAAGFLVGLLVALYVAAIVVLIGAVIGHVVDQRQRDAGF